MFSCLTYWPIDYIGIGLFVLNIILLIVRKETKIKNFQEQIEKLKED